MTNAFEKRLIRFALALKQKAMKPNTPLEESTKAFKEITTFYAILRKQAPKSSEDAGNTTFDALQDEMREVVEQESHNAGTAPPVRSRSGRH